MGVPAKKGAFVVWCSWPYAHLLCAELEMRLELDEISVLACRHNDKKNVCQSEKMTQTDGDLLSGRDLGHYRITPNGTSPCNHPSLSCQVSISNSQTFVFAFV